MSLKILENIRSNLPIEINSNNSVKSAPIIKENNRKIDSIKNTTSYIDQLNTYQDYAIINRALITLNIIKPDPRMNKTTQTSIRFLISPEVLDLIRAMNDYINRSKTQQNMSASPMSGGRRRKTKKRKIRKSKRRII
jgi:hypothetical protein